MTEARSPETVKPTRHDDEILKALRPGSEVETRFFAELLSIGGPHQLVTDDDTRCEEISDPKALCKTPLVSVSVITYNQERYLVQALTSLVDQKTDFEYEILIAEDCSTDATRDIAFKFQQAHPDKVRVFFSDQNVGVTANSRRTLLHARGCYFAYCEGDDFWNDPNKLQLQADFLKQNPDFGLVHGNANRVDLSSKILTEAFQSPSYGSASFQQTDLVGDILSGRRSVITCTTMLRTDLLRRLCRKESLLYSTKFRLGDVQTWLGLTSVAKVQYMAETLASYRYSTTSITARGNPEKRLQFLADACVVDFLGIQIFYADRVELKEILYRRLVSSFICLAFDNRRKSLLDCSLALITSLHISSIPPWAVQTCFSFGMTSALISSWQKIHNKLVRSLSLCHPKQKGV